MRLVLLSKSKRREKKWMERFLRAKRIAIVKKYITPESIVCDIGCGYEGYLLRSLSRHFAYGYGLDKDIASFESQKIRLIKTDIEKEIKLEPNTVDIVFLLAVIEHLENPENLFRECYKILKPKGKFLITTPTKKSKWLLELLAFKLGLLDAKNMAEHKNYFSKQEIASLLTKHDFKDISIENFQFGFNMLVVAQK